MDDVRTQYLRCWNETDATARRALIADHWRATASYTDPMGAARGAAEIDATIAGVQEAFPGFVFHPIGDVDSHHDVTRFRWGLGPEGAPAVIEGFDVVQVDTDGRISAVTGFLDKVPG